MSLKDQFAADIDNVFLNTMDFADTIILNGITLNAVIDDDRLLELSSQAPGVYFGERMVYVKAADLPGKPAVNSRVKIDGDNATYYVTRVTDNMGMYDIFLGAHKT